MEKYETEVLCSALTPIAETEESQVFDPPRKMYVWDDVNKHPVIRLVVAILPNCDEGHRVITSYGQSWGYCCEIGESKVKPRRATWERLAYWLIDGKGLVLDSETNRVDTGVFFDMKCIHEEVGERYYVMARGESKWHEPTIDYLGIKED